MTNSLYYRGELAMGLMTPPEILIGLAKEENSYVRYQVANNPNTPIKTLQNLATDENWAVRMGVAYNPSSTEICRRLVLMTNDILGEL